jgi:hypothetical protein
MTKHVHMSPPSRKEHTGQDGLKLFRLLLAFLVFGFAVVWAGSSGHGEAPLTKLASTLSDRWDRSVAQAPHVLPPLLKRRDGAHAKPASEASGVLASQAVPSLGGRTKAPRKPH